MGMLDFGTGTHNAALTKLYNYTQLHSIRLNSPEPYLAILTPDVVPPYDYLRLAGVVYEPPT